MRELPRAHSHIQKNCPDSWRENNGRLAQYNSLTISVFYIFLFVLIVDSKYIGGYFAFTRSDTVSIIFFDGANKGSIKPRVASKEQL